MLTVWSLKQIRIGNELDAIFACFPLFFLMHADYWRIGAALYAFDFGLLAAFMSMKYGYRGARWGIRTRINRRRQREAAMQAKINAERSAIESERQRQESERRAVREGEAQRRRDDARASVQLLYLRHAPEIASRLPREEFDAFVEEYMNDKRTPEYVEERAKQLQEVILEHKKCVDPQVKPTSVSQLTEWFEGQKREIEALPDGRTKRTLLSQLEERYTEMIERLLEEA